MTKTMRLLFTIEPRDVGSTEIFRYRPESGHPNSGRYSWSVGDLCGRIQSGDVGKRVYLVGDVMQMENPWQRDERKAKQRAKGSA